MYEKGGGVKVVRVFILKGGGECVFRGRGDRFSGFAFLNIF